MKRQKTKEQELGCKFMIIDPDKQHFDISKTISEIFRHLRN